MFYRLRQEFGIVKKIEKQNASNNDHSLEHNIPQKPISSINDDKLPMSKAENAQNKLDCSYTSCDCSRCRNMDGN